MYPRMLVDLEKLQKNIHIVAQACKKQGVDIMGVTKVFCAQPQVAQTMVDSGVKFLADSRVENLKKLENVNIPKVLLRLPMLSQVKTVVQYADISLNSEISVISALGACAVQMGKTHKVVLMVDLGDLREGVLPQNIKSAVKAILDVEGIQLYGLGVNLTCYGGVIPDERNIGHLVNLAQEIEETFDIELEMITAGNSSSYHMIEKGIMPDKVNNLRMGEILVLGRETAYGNLIEGGQDDVFTLQAEIVELKTKGSKPIGEIGMDAFGNTPVFEERGNMLRAIVAIGRQDVEPTALTPTDEAIEILGASSDHLLLNLSDSKIGYAVGDVIDFKLDYGGLLSLATSEYVSIEYKK